MLSSLIAVESGTVEVAGRAVTPGKAGAMGKAGIAVIPEDRHDSGCVLEMTVAENLVMTGLDAVAHRGVLSGAEVRARADSLIDEFDIHTPSPDVPMWQLSGGNQQRLVLARELSQEPAVLVAAQPTRGLDVGAIRVHDRAPAGGCR